MVACSLFYGVIARLELDQDQFLKKRPSDLNLLPERGIREISLGDRLRIDFEKPENYT
jgi:hypothetical protein